MKFLVGILLLGVASAAYGQAATGNGQDNPIRYECNTSAFCNSNARTKLMFCNATLDGFRHVEEGLNNHLNEQLTASFDYLMLAAHYNTYAKNRPGFNKLFQSLSDKAWDNTISLIKHITKRGGKVQTIEIRKENNGRGTTAVDEVEAMGMALNYEKKLAHSVQKVHRQAEHHTHGHDPETGHYLEDRFLEPQTENIRKLAGYTTDLAKFSLTADASLAFFIFDEYLQKQI